MVQFLCTKGVYEAALFRYTFSGTRLKPGSGRIILPYYFLFSWRALSAVEEEVHFPRLIHPVISCEQVVHDDFHRAKYNSFSRYFLFSYLTIISNIIEESKVVRGKRFIF